MKDFIYCLLLIMFLISCDKEVGTDGVVIDAVSGKRIENVDVHMKSDEQGDERDTTDSTGYFITYKTFSCGIASCNTNYKISFTKDGYVYKEITENYEDLSDAEFIAGNSDSNDTLVIKLDPIE
jgi:hypothetical protein